jgi:hypothetical protein
MGVTSTQGIQFQLVANDVILDLFKDEEILLSNNVTGLFDLGKLPSDFTRQIKLPGTKKNNAFFEHVYDISITNPDTFATNKKVECYLDFAGIYASQGYLQLDKVTVFANKFIDSYEISIYGSLSSFAREINRSYLTDMTASLSQFDHTASLQAITGSWNGNLFNGDIVYPFAEYGQEIIYSNEPNTFGINTESGSLFVQDYKPAIRIKKVWDAIFNEYGYTYTGDFWDEPFLNNVYMVCNNSLRYPKFEEFDLETYGQFKIAPVSGSTNYFLNTAISGSQLFYFNVQSNPGGNIDTSTLTYSLEYPSKLRGKFNLNVEVSGSGGTNAVPQFDLVVKDLSGTKVVDTPLVQINEYFRALRGANQSQGLATPNQKYAILSEFNTPVLPSGSYQFWVEFSQLGSGTLTAILDPDNELKSYLQVTKVGNVGENKVMKIGANMPFGTKGIKKADFISAIQKKFNLVIYPSKINRNQFIVESFNKWYKEGVQWDFNQYVNLDKPIDVIPANNLAVNELNFGDTLDNDYISQQFSKEANREYGKTYYVDTQNFFSQGNFEVKTSFASSPIAYLAGTGISGSRGEPEYFVRVEDFFERTAPSTCALGPANDDVFHRTYAFLVDSTGAAVVNFGGTIVVEVKYEDYVCNSGPFDTFRQISIPFGASQGFVEYLYSGEFDCGFFECLEDSSEPQCVNSITGGPVLFPSSPIPAC